MDLLLMVFVPILGMGLVIWAIAALIQPRSPFLAATLDTVLTGLWVDECRAARVEETLAAKRENRLDRFALVGKTDNRRAYQAWREELFTWLQVKAHRKDIERWLSNWRAGLETETFRSCAGEVHLLARARLTVRPAVAALVKAQTSRAHQAAPSTP